MVGYNLTEAQKVIDKINDNYAALDNTIVSNWENLKRTLRREWIGYDEEDFEKKFAQRLIDLSAVTSAVANSSMETIYKLAEAWHKFQASNTLDGSVIQTEPFKLELKATKARESGSISSGGLQLSDSVTKGLKNGTQSANIIHTEVESFVNNIKNKAENLANGISTERAFAGEQSASIKAYLKKCTEATATMATSVNDLDEALSILLGKNYGASSQNVSDEFQSASSSIDGTIKDINRWE